MDGERLMASAMRAARTQLEIAAHNLANVSTDGFRRTAGTTRLGSGGLTVARRAVHEQGAVRHTGRAFDLALLGDGAFRVGATVTREGAFTRDRDGFVVDDRGRRLRGARGDVRVSQNGSIAADGTIREGERIVDRLPLPPGTRVLSGALETSGVNAIGETLAILTAQRAFETAEKTLSAIDAARQKASNDVARVQ